MKQTLKNSIRKPNHHLLTIRAGMARSILMCIALALPLYVIAGSGITVDKLLCENLTDPVAIMPSHQFPSSGEGVGVGLEMEGAVVPHFSWMNHSSQSNDVQTAYEIEVATTEKLLLKGKADVWKSGKVASKESVMVPYNGRNLLPRHLYYWRVRTWNRSGLCSAWSKTARFGVGIISDKDFKGEYITTLNTNNTTPVLSTTTDLKRLPRTAVMHVNSLGYHELYINGKRVGEQVLAPAVSQLDKHSLTVSYDVTSYLKKGKNVIAIWLGKGWYKKNNFANAMETPVVRAELDDASATGATVIAATDATWKCNADGVGYLTDIGTWAPLQFGGERIDARKGKPSVDKVGTAGVKVVSVSQKSTPQMFVGNKIVARLKPQSIKPMGDKKWLIDFGRNITGWFSADFGLLKEGQEITMEYSDDYTTEPQLSGEKDVLIASSQLPSAFCNRFNHHAYRYVVLSGLDEKPSIDKMEALQIAANQAETTSFSCSDSDINAIHDMIQRTLRCLTFSGYMVDCPHLERMGYGGDGNSSTMTLQTMQDAATTYYNWLDAWSDAQDEDGGMPHVAPAGGGGGGPYWCGFIIQASWRAYLNYGDDRMIRKHYCSMKKWLDYVEKYSLEGLLQRWPDTKNRMWFLGDWLTPAGVDAGNERSVSIVSNCFVSECLQSMAMIAKYLGRNDDAAKYLQWRTRLNKKIHEAFFNEEENTYATASPLDMSYAMNADVVPPYIYNNVCEQLENLSRTKYNTHIAVGLVGVPIFTEWAIRNGKVQLMYDILKQPDYPGYLDMINHGATTTWESWDRSRSRIHNCYNGIGTWFYQSLAGIKPDVDAPGYRHFFVSPQLPEGIDWVKATKQTPYGVIKVEIYRQVQGKKTLKVEIPFGCTATIDGKEYGSGEICLIV
ncbi:MAG: family 78 glycoside hydrolase catalytic domain [Prevotellaceae bacterium]|nr:family 78 glycoside hydrolase catalytic domain [Prevotellaceae bacterium]